jgi:hypothetical protein
MYVRVNQTGNHEPPARVDDPRRGPGEPTHCRRTSDCTEAPVCDSEGLGSGTAGIGCEYLGVDQNEIRRGAGRRRSRQRDQQRGGQSVHIGFSPTLRKLCHFAVQDSLADAAALAAHVIMKLS